MTPTHCLHHFPELPAALGLRVMGQVQVGEEGRNRDNEKDEREI
jgi:hypothetical protein